MGDNYCHCTVSALILALDSQISMNTGKAQPQIKAPTGTMTVINVVNRAGMIGPLGLDAPMNSMVASRIDRVMAASIGIHT